jgi:hypothetical protein
MLNNLSLEMPLYPEGNSTTPQNPVQKDLCDGGGANEAKDCVMPGIS